MDLSSIYCVEFSDDALAPKFPKGTRAFFRPDNHAEDGSVVVVEHDGLRSVRVFRRGVSGPEAIALDDRIRPLHGFRIEGVMCMVLQSKV